MHLRYIGLALVLACSVSHAEEFADTSKLAGTWDLAGKTTWKLAPTKDGVHFTYLRGSQTVADFECNTSGKDCAIKSDGKKATVSVYFNGSLLVMMETRGNEVLKRRFGVLAAGGDMQVETIPLTGNGKAETERYKRVDAQAASR